MELLPEMNGGLKCCGIVKSKDEHRSTDNLWTVVLALVLSLKRGIFGFDML